MSIGFIRTRKNTSSAIQLPHLCLTRRPCSQLLFFSIVSAPFLLCRFSRCFFVRSADADPAGPSCSCSSCASGNGGGKSGSDGSKGSCCCAPRGGRGGGGGGGGNGGSDEKDKGSKGGEGKAPALVGTVVAVELPLAIPSESQSDTLPTDAPPTDAPPADKKGV